MVAVKTLSIGDVVMFNGDCPVIVTAILSNAVGVKKTTAAKLPLYTMSIGFYSHKFDNLINMVEKVS